MIKSKLNFTLDIINFLNKVRKKSISQGGNIHKKIWGLLMESKLKKYHFTCDKISLLPPFVT